MNQSNIRTIFVYFILLPAVHPSMSSASDSQRSHSKHEQSNTYNRLFSLSLITHILYDNSDLNIDMSPCLCEQWRERVQTDVKCQ